MPQDWKKNIAKNSLFHFTTKVKVVSYIFSQKMFLQVSTTSVDASKN